MPPAHPRQSVAAAAAGEQYLVVPGVEVDLPLGPAVGRRCLVEELRV